MDKVCNRLKGILISNQTNLLESLVTNGSLYKIDTLTICYYYNNSYSSSHLKFTQAEFVSCAMENSPAVGGAFEKHQWEFRPKHTQGVSYGLPLSLKISPLVLCLAELRFKLSASPGPPWKSICLYSRNSEWLCVSGNEFAFYNAVFIGRQRWREF